MDVREKLVELLKTDACPAPFMCDPECIYYGRGNCFPDRFADHLIAHGVTVQECGEWVHPKGYVVSNGFLCSKCGHEEASYYPINPVLGGACIADENGNFYHPPKMNYCPHCGAKMTPRPPKGE